MSGRWWVALLLLSSCSTHLGAAANDGTIAITSDARVDADLPQSACNAAIDCPAAPSCYDAACVSQQCVYTASSAGTTCGVGADMCESRSCDGAGSCAATPVVCSVPPETMVPATCPVGTTFPAAFGGDCATTCDPTAGCQYATIDVPCPDPSAALPQAYAYQVVLRNYLASLGASDFDVPGGDITYDSNYTLSTDQLYQLWLGAHYDLYLGGLPDYRMLALVPSTEYLLSTIESSSPPRTQVGTQDTSDPVAALFYWQWNYPGNPYYRLAGTMHRAFATTAADLMMMDDEGTPENLDEASGSLLNYGYVGATLAHEASIDSCVRGAYNVGLRRLFDRYETLNVGNGNGNMLISQAEGYTFMARALGDAATEVRAAAKVQAQLGAICNAAGFCDHQGGGYDPDYEGWSENVLTNAAMFSGAADLRADELSFYRLRSRTSFPQPDGSAMPARCVQSTAFAPATPWGDCINGGDYNYSRDFGIASLDDDALYLVAGGIPGRPSWPTSAQTMIDDITSSRGLSRAVSARNGSSLDANDPDRTRIVAWYERHYPRGMSSSMLFTHDGTFAHITAALAANPELAKLPVMRSDDFVEQFGGDSDGAMPQFFVGKFGGAAPFAAVVHTGYIDTLYDGAGFGGGALDVFWTAAQGQAIFGWNIGRNYTPDDGTTEWFTWTNIAQWPVHALSGRSGSTWFSSARVNQPSVTADLSQPLHAEITVAADLQSSTSSSAPLTGHVMYQRDFALSSTGVVVTTTVDPMGSAPTVDELYETLPLFLYYYSYDGTGEDAESASTITFRQHGSTTFVNASTTPLPNVEAVRVTRFSSTVEIAFTAPFAMSVIDTLADDNSPLPTIAQQTITYTRVLRINLVDGSAPLTHTSISYTIAPLM